jgi:phosphoribosyl 1,2-cyclic phosphate phosphodiesterase
MLGCGTSSGVPRIGNDWGLCDPAEPKNRRRRVSLLVEHDGVRILVDTGPDLREQLLSADIDQVDAILFTHDHADHTHGIDDVRQIFHAVGRPIDCYAHPATWRVLKRRFDYVFEGRGGYPPTCKAHDLPDRLTFGDLSVTWFPQVHGDIESAGFRFGAGSRSAVYSTDVSELPPEADEALQNLDLWILDALRRYPHPSHAHLDRALEWIERYRPRRAVLTHMDNSMDYATLRTELPAGVEPGYDMLAIDL